MQVHHLNCGSLRPITPDPQSPNLAPTPAVSHCLLLETEQDGLVLVDTGLGSADVAQPEVTLGTTFLERSQPALQQAETAAQQVLALGHDLSDVRHIILTHLDLDHAGGLGDFPDALVHVADAELRAAGGIGAHPEHHNRYRPAQWAHQPKWSTFWGTDGDPWFGFDTVAQPETLPSDIRLVPLGGHSAGHTGVAVRIEDSGDDLGRWLLHAGDSYYYHAALDDQEPRSTPGLMYLETITESHRELRLGTNARLRELARRHSDAVQIFCAHDPWEFARMAERG